MDRRQEILDGILTFPPQIMQIMKPNPEQEVLITQFWDNIWHNYLREKPCDTITWFTKFNNPQFFNVLVMHLSKAGWITSSVDANYAYIELNTSKLLKWVSQEELINVKYMYKFNKYRFQKTKSTLYDVVQINGKHISTGITRRGFMKAGNNVFKYDTKYLKKYLTYIVTNIEKGLGTSSKDITYQEILENLLSYYSVDNTEYTLGNNISDSRGRSIFQCAKKIFNPVSNKDARALLITKPQSLTSDGFKVVCGAITELLGYRGKNINDKIRYGQHCYITRELPSLEEMIETHNFDDLHVRIWLERIYENLDNPEHWVVPIELDALASLVQFVGILTNDHNYMNKTNIIGEQLEDIWSVDYVSRKHIKKALTPRLYGSGKHPRELWDASKLQYTTIQLNTLAKDLETGLYANADKFKDFIINNVEPKRKMKVHVWNEKFEIECNRFKWEETKQESYTIYTSAQGILKTVYRSVHMVPDLQQFKRYFVTLLIHGLDSQVANYICEHMDWVLPNHDAFTVHPNDGHHVRELYTSQLMEIYKNRKTILQNYFRSIGITTTYRDKHEEELKEFLPWCLK